MKKQPMFCLAVLLATALSVQATVRTVTTDVAVGPGSLAAAINALADGDTIAFHIPPEAGEVHYINVPPDGFPLITNNNITVDGYTQGGASANTASIHSANNAALKIVLSATNGNALSMYSACTNVSGVAYPNFGFGDSEQAVLGFFRASNAWVRGICFLAAPSTSTTVGGSGDCKTLCFAQDAADVSSKVCANFHVSGCWFGVDPVTKLVSYMPDGITVATPAICIATYGTGTNGVQPGVVPNIDQYSSGTCGVAAGSANPRAEFNVFVTGYGFDTQGGPFRVSGNFWNVLPDGVTLADISVLDGGSQQSDAYFEAGSGDHMLIGTDGDGVNDADEANIFGSYANGGVDLYFYGSMGSITVAGNTFGADINGNSFNVGNISLIAHNFKSNPNTQIRFGSDFNGVSDSLEGNLVVDHTLFQMSGQGNVNSHWVSVRGNSFTNCLQYGAGSGRLPIGDGQTFDVFDQQGTYTNFVDVSGGTAAIIPVIGGGTTATTLVGTCGKALAAPYTRVIVDLYQADPATATTLPAGMKWLGSYTDNSAADGNPASGAFSFDISALGLASGAKVTVAVTYSEDIAPTITSVKRSGTSTTLNLTGATGPGGDFVTYGILKSTTVNGLFAATAAISGSSGAFTDSNNPISFYRASGPTANGMTSPFSDVYTIP